MNHTSPLAVMAIGLAMAGPVFAQSSDTPAADAGAGAAAAVSGGDAAAEAPADGAAADQAEGATTEGSNDQPVELAEGETVLPNGMDITPDYQEYGRWYNADGIPTYKIEDDGTLDFATFNGYRRYSAECHVCHGPDGEGSTYAPALKNSVLNMDYYEFQEVVASGKQEVNSAQNQVMPAFATNRNVWCYIDDIYAYLLARGTDAVPRGRPAKKGDKSDEFTAQEDSCMSG